ncbi:Transcription factor CPC like [Actinidia chinensis var. chinensis]|uniref:Transcription factor CPC like n=1 Tax=Actinidia chinensis var. chinensis TaxID=1590841 RepID=A0A2R6RBC2_ACTCC|nr:Transcription factor CPC like [Actinidia chinensis var. chinensis]
MEDLISHSSDEQTQDNNEVTTQNPNSGFSEDEDMLIARMFSLVGERWSLIAGRIPGRTAEEIEKYWVSKYASSSTTKR